MTVAALFVSPSGPYFGRPGVDPWDEARDARLYTGSDPVVCHPPCQLWVNLAAVNWKRYGRQRPAWYAGGDDGGCFSAALGTVLRNGGVLEHPAHTHAWREYGLPSPLFGDNGQGWTCHHGMWVCEVWQSAYGHRAQKRTWLLYVSLAGHDPFELRWERPKGTHQVGWFDREKPTVGKREAYETPPAFAEALLELARHSRGGAL